MSLTESQLPMRQGSIRFPKHDMICMRTRLALRGLHEFGVRYQGSDSTRFKSSLTHFHGVRSLIGNISDTQHRKGLELSHSASRLLEHGRRI